MLAGGDTMTEELIVYPQGFPNGIEIGKFRRFLEEESKQTGIPFDTMIAAYFEGGMIDLRTWELLGS
jgi:hypothetical protein